MDAVEFKVRAQSLGVRLEGCPAITRRGGAGPAEGLCLLFAGLEATVPVSPAFVRESPFSLVGAGGEGCRVMEGGRELFEAEPAPDPAYYNYTTSDGTPMRRIAVRHSRDCLGSTLLQTCSRLPRCGFCAIDLSLEQGLTTARKSPEQLLEVATIAVVEGFTHAVLTTGTPPGGDRGLVGLAAGAAALKAAGLAAHVQFEPPEDPGSMDGLAGAATSAGIHIESFDEAVRRRVAPGKCSVTPEGYVAAWKAAVELLGVGRVSSFIIAGLGEDDRSILEGARLLSSLGVYPYILPLRPIPGTPLGGAVPPPPERMLGLYEAAAKIIGEAGFTAAGAGAGCVLCGSCSAITHFTG